MMSQRGTKGQSERSRDTMSQPGTNPTTKNGPACTSHTSS